MPLIVVLDGRDVPNPEDMAMLAAMYSRSPKSVLEHLKVVQAKGSENFHDKYYVGYGHKSIGDCGGTNIFIEGVSMLVAKAVQDHPLYNGQEASTRYIDFTTQPVLNPLGTNEGREVQESWMDLYASVYAALVPMLKELHPREPDQKPLQWETAIKARAFDIARSLIPAGGTTNVAWGVANLRQTNDHLKEMRNHPLPEVRDVAGDGLIQLKAKYASTFNQKLYEAEENYIAKSMARFAFYGADDPVVTYGFGWTHNLDLAGLARHRDLLEGRPPKTELHQRLRQYGSIQFRFGIDFASYRDLQRQRSAVQEMPLLTTKHGFHEWYVEKMPPNARDRIAQLATRVDRLDCDAMIKQYYTPMGFNVPVVITCPLPAAVYIAELRSGETVHPTLRVLAQRMGDALSEIVPGLAMHHDKSPDKWSFKRGAQDIVKKESV